MENRSCRRCGKSFIPLRINRNYCYDQTCESGRKNESERLKYPIGSDAKQAIQKNYRIFSKRLNNSITEECNLKELLKLGFNPAGYFGIINYDGAPNIFRVHDFLFKITEGTPQKIQIWKQLKQY